MDGEAGGLVEIDDDAGAGVIADNPGTVGQQRLGLGAVGCDRGRHPETQRRGSERRRKNILPVAGLPRYGPLPLKQSTATPYLSLHMSPGHMIPAARRRLPDARREHSASNRDHGSPDFLCVPKSINIMAHLAFPLLL
jgi:hypothetical protein